MNTPPENNRRLLVYARTIREGWITSDRLRLAVPDEHISTEVFRFQGFRDVDILIVDDNISAQKRNDIMCFINQMNLISECRYHFHKPDSIKLPIWLSEYKSKR